ncbi:MAG: tRNA dihydrouridine(16) synthase DusC [Gammaproteobacteria bacterium]|nr:MAG: tRNA dihydrouridine(16) synthase DusC [Gammaproteobacteria bacterium]
MQIMLAPMEGVVDAPMRDFLTQIGGYDRCVTEFIRVVDNTYPDHVFSRFCPELATGGRTAAGVPVHIQLLGSNPEAMASNARQAAKLGALGIDINFGCPSKTVNQRDGGSAVLREPARMTRILCAVRDAVPADTPVSAKIRLGYEHADDFSAIIAAIKRSGIDELCVHARTKKHGYKPPAYWTRVAEARQQLGIPVIVNGEIWTPAQARQARSESTCQDIMLGRGAVAYPDLARHIRAEDAGESYMPMAWPVIADKVYQQALTLHQTMPRYAGMRTKQWLRYLSQRYPEAQATFERVKRHKTFEDMRGSWCEYSA